MFLTILYFYFLSLGVSLSQAKDFVESEKALDIHWQLLRNCHSQGQTAEDRNKYYFYKMVNAFELNDKGGVVRFADHLLAGEYFSNSETPLRYLDMARIMKAEAETWVDKEQIAKGDLPGDFPGDDLGDISREMKKARDRLERGYAGSVTQGIQRDIEARLKKMIDKEEAARSAAEQEAAAKAAAEEKEEAARRAARADGNFPQMPAEDSGRAGAAGTGLVDRRKVKEIADVWGKLPEKDRARALLELTRNMPAKDKQVVEKYFRELQKRTK